MSELRQVPSYPELWCTEEGQVLLEKDGAIRPVKPYRLKNGYLNVSPTLADGRRKMLYVHALVCEAFKGPRPTPESVCLHGDGDGLNNRPGNLNWGTREQNERDKQRHGRSNAGENHPAAKFTKLHVFAAREASALGVASKDIAARYGVTPQTVASVLKGKTWRDVPGSVPPVGPPTGP